MRLWRALTAAGAGVLRDGAYLLPDRPATETLCTGLRRQVLAQSGKAFLLRLPSQPPATELEFRTCFDRDEAHRALQIRIDTLRRTLVRSTAAGASRAFARLQKDCAALHEIDYFPGTVRGHVDAALRELDTLIATRFASGEPHARVERATPRRAADYHGRVWTTRAGLWADRMASAWLIRRFIDRRARFVWFATRRKPPRGAIGFDFDGAEFTHVGTQVTFERLLQQFGLESDAALQRLGAIIHCLDVGGRAVPEAAPVEAVLRDICARTDADDQRLKRASALFDALYAGFQPEAAAS